MTRKTTAGVTYDAVVRLGLALPGVEESTSDGTPALKVKGSLMTRLWEDGKTLVVKTTFEERDELMAADGRYRTMFDLQAARFALGLSDDDELDDADVDVDVEVHHD